MLGNLSFLNAMLKLPTPSGLIAKDSHTTHPVGDQLLVKPIDYKCLSTR